MADLENSSKSITGQSITLPGEFLSTNVLKGFALTGGAITASSGTSKWTGLDITMPNINQSGGTIISTGVKITGGTVTAGTSYGLIIDSNSGNVGIGTTSPGSILHLSSSDSNPALTITSTANTSMSRGGAIILQGKSNSTGPVISSFAQMIGGKESSTQGESNAYLSLSTNNGTILTEWMRITSAGNVGIGTTSPGNKLAVSGGVGIGTTASGSLYLSTKAPDGSLIVENRIGIGTTSPAYALDVIVAGTGPIARFANASDNSSCAFIAGGVLTCTSDQRLKKNIADSSYGLNEIMGLRPVEFNWKSQSSGSQKTIGFVAQDVEGLLPQLVITDANGYKELNTIGMVPVLVKGMQEQQGELNNFQSSISNFQSVFNNSMNQLNDNSFSVNDKINILGKSLTDVNEILKQIQDSSESLSSTSAQQEKRIKDLEDRMKLLQEENQAVIDFAKVFDPKTMVYKDSLGNLDLGEGKITVKEIEAAKITTKDIEATNSVTTKVLGVDTESSGKSKIKAGDSEVTIETPEASKDVKIYITPTGPLYGKALYVDDDNTEEGKSFKVKFDGDPATKDIHFNWLIIK